MNFQSLWTWGVAALLMVSSQVSRAALPDPIDGLVPMEVPVEAVLAPQQGYDNNDNIQVIIHGSLPNSCYVLHTPVAEVTAANQYRVRQYAAQKTTGICADPETLPTTMRYAVPFQTEVSLGQLPVGEYEFRYVIFNGTEKSHVITVSQATVPTIDSLPYAAVTQVAAPDVTTSLKPIPVVIMGVLNSSCTVLDREVRVVHSQGVDVLLPTIRTKPGVLCTQVARPFSKTVTLPRSAPGHRLIHVRSMSGTSVNRIIEIMR